MRSEILSLLWKHKKTRPQTDLPSLLFINASLQSNFSLQWPTCSLCFLSLPRLSISFSLECSFSSLPQALSLWCGNFILSSHSWISSFCFYTLLLFLPTVSSTQWLGHYSSVRCWNSSCIFGLVYTYIHTKARKVWLHLLTSHFSTTSNCISFWSDSWLYFKYTDLSIADRML